jgi:hypothetical protein
MSEQSSETNFDMVLTMGVPAEIVKFAIERSDERQLALTAIELSWTSLMPYPKDSYLNILINSNEIGPQTNSAKGAVNCSSNLQLEVKCTFITSDKIMVTGMFNEDLVAGTFIFFMITNLYVDIIDPKITKSWVMTVWTQKGYFIDQISDGLDFEYKCSVPC